MSKVMPSIKRRSFDCPHCGAHAQQDWFSGFASSLSDKMPVVYSANELSDLEALAEGTLPRKTVSRRETVSDRQKAANVFGSELTVARRQSAKLPVLFYEFGKSQPQGIDNIFFSMCNPCKKITIWLHDRIIFPTEKSAPPVHPDTPEHIKPDYNEASEIASISPRGSAALIRLCIQKLCKELGGGGKDINKDIGELVKNGLRVEIQQALDAVRVIGNEAVHPATLDLRDDKATALTLFTLFNLIVEKMIAEPRLIKEVYAGLPAGKIEGIAIRDKASGKD